MHPNSYPSPFSKELRSHSEARSHSFLRHDYDSIAPSARHAPRFRSATDGAAFDWCTLRGSKAVYAKNNARPAKSAREHRTCKALASSVSKRHVMATSMPLPTVETHLDKEV